MPLPLKALLTTLSCAAVFAACSSGMNRAEMVSGAGGTPVTVEAARAVSPLNATLAVTTLPEGWTFSRQLQPSTTHGNSVTIQWYEGPVVGIDVPGDGPARLSVVVNAALIEGIGANGRDQDLRSLAGPGEEFLADRQTEIDGRRALVLSRRAGPVTERMIVFTIGDWRLQVIGAGVDEEVLLAMAEEVELQ